MTVYLRRSAITFNNMKIYNRWLKLFMGLVQNAIVWGDLGTNISGKVMIILSVVLLFAKHYSNILF